MQPLTEALTPVRSALLAAAEQDATAELARADAHAARILADARRQAAQIVAEAQSRGAADATTALAAERARQRRAARAVVLAAGKQAYDRMRACAREAVTGFVGDPQVRQRLEQMARAELGPSLEIRDAPDGGIIARAGGRRLDLSLAGFAERAAEQSAARWNQP
ncbi:hypothetical protein AB0F81_13015 [Actinoplanes sp. NPDC024001]|uniref:hypothetical protein n=1 Tax=Actinoplanes sp. NPDC024001 TaxID=3154598 RepID=UPI0033D6D3C7